MKDRGTDVTELKKVYRTAVKEEFPEILNVSLKKEYDLRYGENPNQPAAAYSIGDNPLASLIDIKLAKTGKGGLSATNIMDITRALDILKFFHTPAVAVMKHLIPSGFATDYHKKKSLSEIYTKARDADARAAFGSVVVFNSIMDVNAAESLNETFVEVVAAPGYAEGAIDALEHKKDARIALFSNIDKIPKYDSDDDSGLYDMKALPGGRIIIQKPYLSSIKGKDSLILDPMVIKDNVKHVVAKDPNEDEIKDLLIAWYVNIGVRSNGIVIVKNGVTLAVGSGQQERVGALEQAIVKAYQKSMDREGIKYDPINGAVSREYLSNNPLSGAVVSSDAFFPFRDSIDIMAEHGITSLIQPGGSKMDFEVIDAVNEHGMSMAYTLERCFGHF